MKKIKLNKQWTDSYGDHDDLKDDLISSDSYSLSENYFDIYLKKDNVRVLKFATCEMPFCCGIIEIGELNKIECEKLSQKLFNNLFGFIVTNDKRTLMINTLDTGNSSSWNKYLENCPYFKKVKSFKNPNSGNNINVWISI